MIRFFRFGVRLLALGFVILVSVADYCVSVCLRSGDGAFRSRLAWMQRSSRRFLRALNIHVTSGGVPPHRGLIVCNHLGYLDIVVMGAVAPMVFVSKSEVRAWPVFGWMSCRAGTLYVDRARRLDVERVTGEITRTLGKGVVVTLFPEGTSTGGREVLPFRSSLLEPAASHRWPVAPACVAYNVPGGSAETDACYWGNMDFVRHLGNLMAVKIIHASVVFGSPIEKDLGRKQLAASLHSEVVRLKNAIDPGTGTIPQMRRARPWKTSPANHICN